MITYQKFQKETTSWVEWGPERCGGLIKGGWGWKIWGMTSCNEVNE